jgi:hypothetical protein
MGSEVESPKPKAKPVIVRIFVVGNVMVVRLKVIHVRMQIK